MTDWPELSAERDHETLGLLHLAAQMIGKIRVAHAPWLNHGWHVALQPNARGLGIYPTAASEGRTFTLTLDLCRHAIVLWISDGGREEVPLNAGSIAALHRRLVAILEQHDLPSTFNGHPNELPDAPPFAEDNVRRDYDRDSAERFRAALAPMCPHSRDFALGSAGRRARCTSGAAHSTSRSATSPAARRPSILAESPDPGAEVRARHIATR